MADIKFDNPNFNKEKYGKYFDDNGKIKDFKGWLDARNNDLKASSDPVELVNKINNQNQYGNEKYDKFFRGYGEFINRMADRIPFGEVYDEDGGFLDKFDKDKQNEIRNAYKNNLHLGEEQAETEFMKEFLKAEFENQPRNNLIKDVLKEIYTYNNDTEVNQLVKLLQDFLDLDE